MTQKTMFFNTQLEAWYLWGSYCFNYVFLSLKINITVVQWGVANRGAAVRVGRDTQKDGKGYFEDRRPASNMDPYVSPLWSQITILWKPWRWDIHLCLDWDRYILCVNPKLFDSFLQGVVHQYSIYLICSMIIDNMKYPLISLLRLTDP